MQPAGTLDETSLTGRRALVAVRGATVGLAIAGWLRGWGLHVTRIDDAAQALATGSFDLVIADLPWAPCDLGAARLIVIFGPDEAIPPGAAEALPRPVQAPDLRAAVGRVLAPAEEIDLAAIEQLWGRADSPGFRRVAAVFAAEAPQRLDAITAAWAAGQRALLQREAHSLVGAAGNVGCPALARTARAVERLAPGGEAAAIDSAIAALAAAQARELPALRRLTQLV